VVLVVYTMPLVTDLVVGAVLVVLRVEPDLLILVALMAVQGVLVTG
jgi:hypothetical protein